MTEVDQLRAELALRKQQIGIMANCLDHISKGSVAPKPIKIAADVALAGAMQIADEIRALPATT